MGVRKLVVGIGITLVASLGPRTVDAQWTFTPSLTVDERYDDNIFGVANNEISDFITQFTPEFSLAYDTAVFNFLLGYRVTGEIYADHSELDNFGENQRGRLEFGYRASPVLTLGLSAFAARTNDPTSFLQPAPTSVGAPPTPGGVVPPPTVTLGRQTSYQYGLTASASYQFDPRWSGVASYSFSGVDQDGTGSSTEHIGSVGARYQLTREDQLSATVSGGVLKAENESAVSVVTLLPGWSREWSERLTTNLAAGPQFTDGNLDVAVNASLSYHIQRELSLFVGYSFETSLAVGESGAQTVSALSAGLSYQPLRELTARVYGAWNRSSPLQDTSSAETTDTYSAGLSVSYLINRWLTAFFSYQFSLSTNGDSIRNNEVTVGLTASYPIPF
jgi:hypothetical protein